MSTPLPLPLPRVLTPLPSPNKLLYPRSVVGHNFSGVHFDSGPLNNVPPCPTVFHNTVYIHHPIAYLYTYSSGQIRTNQKSEFSLLPSYTESAIWIKCHPEILQSGQGTVQPLCLLIHLGGRWCTNQMCAADIPPTSPPSLLKTPSGFALTDPSANILSSDFLFNLSFLSPNKM